MKLYNSIGPNPRVVKMFLAEKGLELDKVPVDLMAGALENADGLLQRADNAIDLRRPRIGDEDDLHRACSRDAASPGTGRSSNAATYHHRSRGSARPAPEHRLEKDAR